MGDREGRAMAEWRGRVERSPQDRVDPQLS
jgi:hypothetical protein